MPITSAIILLITVLATAFLSGIFGMAGGLILMGVLLSLLSVPQAMVAHGLLQMLANGWRCYLLRTSIQRRVLAYYCVGTVLAIGLLFFVAFRPSRPVVLLLLGLVPFLIWLPKSVFRLDAQNPAHAVLAGFLVTGLNTFAGVAGPILDIFFVRTTLTRHQIVATKSVTQLIAHFVKVIFWSGLAFGALSDNKGLLIVLLLAIPFSMTGTWVGGFVLDRLSDKSFLRWVRGLVTGIGIVFLGRAMMTWFGG
ncbi:MAG: TSUP family transporter [Robiginitomaculum sp.]|nr:TSUP family transporter [Robiginitomaculum sp.]